MATNRGRSFALGVDYGTNSVRALVVDTANGEEIATHVFAYPSGDEGVLLDAKNPNLARQNPADYIEGFYTSVRRAVTAAKKHRGFKPELVVGIGVDTTGSTPIPVDREGMPLALQAKFKKKLAAQAWLWKDHTSHAEAAEITAKAKDDSDRYLTKCGGTYSSEWYWSKILHCKREDPKVFEAAYSWVELADFIPAFITGNTDPLTIKRSICAAGHKAMYHTQWTGLPNAKFLASLDPDLAKVREHYASEAVPSDQVAGHLTAGPAFGGEGEAITTAGALQHGLTTLGWDAAVCGPGPGILGSGTALGHGGLVALESAHTALALGCPVVLCARMSSGDPRERHRGLSHHTVTVLELLLAPVTVAAPEGEAAVVPAGRAGHRVQSAAADLEGYAASGLPARTMGRGLDEDPLFFAAALAAGGALAAAIEETP